MSLSCIDRTIDYTAFAGKSWQKKMDICNECKCCEQHMFRKPRYVLPSVQGYDYIDVLDTTNGLRYRECKCKCRFLARRMCEQDNYEIMTASPCPSELPLPRKDWLKKERDDDLRLLDEATHEALEHYWKGQVKACQYAIFHIC